MSFKVHSGPRSEDSIPQTTDVVFHDADYATAYAKYVELAGKNPDKENVAYAFSNGATFIFWGF